MTPPKSDSLTGQAEPSLPAWAEGRFTLEELKQMAEDDDETGCLELKDFLEELKAIAQGSQHGN
ncbi:MAG: hypothetical protein L0Y72_10645 [Gemmataceae bacterium]|nr:hypothetical protein [Gemmataceae bacterium]MCI0739492.1 hypothetical protein [Gemmataceae bacterium]